MIAMLHTGTETQSSPTPSIKPPTTTVEDESPILDDLLQQAQEFDLKTVDGIRGKAKVVFEASQRVGAKKEEAKKLTREERVEAKKRIRKEFDHFCVKLDLKSSSCRQKWKKIGQMAPRFEPEHIKKLLPLTWTTWYRLAKCSDREFKEIVDSGKLSRHVTAKTINEIIPTKKKEKPSAKAKRKVMITVADMDEAKTLDLIGKFDAFIEGLKNEFPIAIKLSPSLAQLMPAV
jgi:hypothetical protein